MSITKKTAGRLNTEKGYSTKYALTQGIYAVTVDLDLSDGKKYVYTLPPAGSIRQQLVRGKTYFAVLENAISEAKKMAERKVKSLKMELARTERLANNPWLAWEKRNS
jgi:hypothetical protein